MCKYSRAATTERATPPRHGRPTVKRSPLPPVTGSARDTLTNPAAVRPDQPITDQRGPDPSRPPHPSRISPLFDPPTHRVIAFCLIPGRIRAGPGQIFAPTSARSALFCPIFGPVLRSFLPCLRTICILSTYFCPILCKSCTVLHSTNKHNTGTVQFSDKRAR